MPSGAVREGPAPECPPSETAASSGRLRHHHIHQARDLTLKYRPFPLHLDHVVVEVCDLTKSLVREDAKALKSEAQHTKIASFPHM